MSTTEERKTTTDKLEKLEITPINFPAHRSIMWTLQNDLATLMASFFKSILHDYYGCFLHIDPNSGTPYVMLYLAMNNNEVDKKKVKCLVDISSGNTGKTVQEKMSAVQNMATSVHYELTDDAKKLFTDGDLLGSYAYNGKWDNRRFHVHVDPYNRNNTFVGIAGLDISAILKKIYGKTNSHGHKIIYTVKPVKYVDERGNMLPNVLLSVEANDAMEINELYSDLGLARPNVGNIPMIR